MNAASVSSILHEGSVVNTRIGINITWYRNIIYKCEGNIVHLALMEEYLKNLIMVGSKIVLKLSGEYFEYLFEGTVSEISTEFPSQIAVRVNKSEEIINTRVFPRYDTYLASDIVPVWDSKNYFGIVTNISLGGIAFVSKHSFDYGEECNVNIFIPNDKRVLCKGKVIRKIGKGEYIEYSMQFIEMDETNNNFVSEYLEEQAEIVERLKSNFHDTIKAHIK